MRKSREEAGETRKRIVEAAARAFRANGIVASGLADLMGAAGLTHGGFYKHFESKDQLVAEACGSALRELTGRIEAWPTLLEVVSGYLSAEHRDHPAAGCPFAAIGSELARSDAGTRAVVTAGFERLVDLLCEKARGKNARRRALVAASAMIGALTMSRVVNRPELSEEILREVVAGLTIR